MVATWSVDSDFGTFDFSGAYNATELTVESVDPNPEELSGLILADGTPIVQFDRARLGTYTDEFPGYRFSLNTAWAYNNWLANVRGTQFGSFVEVQVSEANDRFNDSEWIWDVELGYEFDSGLGLYAGSNNVFNTYPEETRPASSLGNNFYDTISPYGFTGGTWYVRGALSWWRMFCDAGTAFCGRAGFFRVVLTRPIPFHWKRFMSFVQLRPALLCLAVCSAPALVAADDVSFSPVQPALFSDPGGQSNAWGDYDNDGDLDLIVLFRDAPVRLYQNSPDRFEDVASGSGLATDGGNPRSVAWGDYDNDGDLDIYIAYSGREPPANRLFRNDTANGRASFTDVAEEAGVALQGLTRQVSFIDYDSDGDLDLFVALRASPNRLFRNDDGKFSDVTFQLGLFEPRRTVGACWFDMDADGDLDLFTANQNGDRDGVYRNDNGKFSDVAIELNMDQPRRPLFDGSVGCAVTDFDTDGDLDLYVAEYGDDSLFRNNGDGTFTDVAEQWGVAVHDHIVTGVWGDIQHDGHPDLYTVGYVNGKPGIKDYLFVSDGSKFVDSMPAVIAKNDTDHGVQWGDFDQDGDLDLALAANDPAGSHYLYRNNLAPGIASRSIQVLVLDENGHYTRAGSEVRAYRAGSDELLGSRIVDTGSGYNAQNAKPVHIGLRDSVAIDIEVTVLAPSGRQSNWYRNIDWKALAGKPYVVNVGYQ